MDEFKFYRDEDVDKAWEWFISFLSDAEWKNRRANIEDKIKVTFRTTPAFSKPLTEGVLLVVREDLIGWYLYLVDSLLHEPYSYEYFQGARVIPIFKRLGADLNTLKKIRGIDIKVKDLLRKRKTEADALLFEILTALLWAKNGYEVAFIEEVTGKKTSDFTASRGNESWNIECKRQAKTSDYSYRETAKRQKMISFLAKDLMERNVILDITFHEELEKLPDTFLWDTLKDKLDAARPGSVISNKEVDINLAFVNIPAIKAHLADNMVKHNSPVLNTLIGGKPIDNICFTCGIFGQLVKVGEGQVNNLYVNDIDKAYGVYWKCDSREAEWSKARNIKSQVSKALKQFNSEKSAVIHVGLETFDGPEVEKIRLGKIQGTIDELKGRSSNLKWIFCHFFQAYSPPDECWVFDETVASISINGGATPPLRTQSLVVPDDPDGIEGIFHWER